MGEINGCNFQYFRRIPEAKKYQDAEEVLRIVQRSAAMTNRESFRKVYDNQPNQLPKLLKIHIVNGNNARQFFYANRCDNSCSRYVAKFASYACEHELFNIRTAFITGNDTKFFGRLAFCKFFGRFATACVFGSTEKMFAQYARTMKDHAT